MQTNRRIPAIVCLSMIVSGCANEDLFDNWNNADQSESVNPDIRATDMKASDMAQCSPSCPFTWTEDFSGGHFQNSDASVSLWKTSAATWVLGHSTDPLESDPNASWSICVRDNNNTGKCTNTNTQKLTFLGYGRYGGPTSGSYSAIAFFPDLKNTENSAIVFQISIVPCNDGQFCNKNTNATAKGNSDLTITTVPSNILIKRYSCTSIACAEIDTGPMPHLRSVQGIRITYSKRAGAANYEYLNFTVDSLTLTGTGN